jgi:DNA gyrase/topoisomerase IV subunit B
MDNVKYGIDEIQSLSFKEGVRSRIQMYLGSDDLEGTYQAFKEIINNSTDEAIAGFGNKIEIGVDEEINGIRVRDYGRGVPFGTREDGENVLVSIYSKSHTGGKFEEGAYKNASGLNGIGAKCVCLSALWFDVFSYRNGKGAHASFKKGELVLYEEYDSNNTPNGTIVEFSPDPEVFKTGKIGYSYKKICEDIKNISYLYSGITFEIKNENTNEVKSYCARNGIIDFVKDNITKPLHKHIIHDTITDTNSDKLEIAFQWGGGKEQSYVFVNGLLCPEGGSPITGAKTSITRTFNSLSKQNFDGDSIRGGLFYVINCSVAQPSFANQTKSKINNTNLRTMASNCFSNALKQMKLKYSEEFESIVELLKKVAKAEAAAERARRQVMEATKDIEKNQKKKVFSSDKLKDAEFLGPNATLLIAEGDSALGGLAQGRDYTKYGIMAIRGKILNCLTHPDEKIYQNEEIKLLLSAMNIIPGKYNASKLRYGRLAICTDADSDGYHIGLLIMAALQYLAPEFIKEGRLCWLRSPLYIVTNGKQESYYFTDEEMDAARGKIKGEVQRNKGLGSLEPEQARRSMFSDEYQRMDVLQPTPAALYALEQLMGKDVEPRKEFIFNHIDFSEVKE